MISGFSKNIACEPFKVEEDQEKGNVRVGTMHVKVVSARVQLVPLKVIFGNEEHDIAPGDYVYVTQAGSNQIGMTSQWTKSIDIDLGGGKTRAVVMVPLDSVQLVDRKRDDGADLMRGYRSDS
jgi:hypothetical protein